MKGKTRNLEKMDVSSPACMAGCRYHVLSQKTARDFQFSCLTRFIVMSMLMALMVATVGCLNRVPGVLWEKSLTGEANNKVAQTGRQTSDGGYIIAGFSGRPSDAWLVKVNSSGDLEWENTYGGSNNDGASEVLQTSDGGYILSGSTESFGFGFNSLLVRTDSEGNLLWQRGYEAGIGNCSVAETEEGGFMFVGERLLWPDNKAIAFIVRTDPEGNQLWVKTYGGEDGGGGYDHISPTADGNYIISGRKVLKTGGSLPWLVKVNPEGEVIWERTLEGFEAIYADYVEQTSDGGYILKTYNYTWLGELEVSDEQIAKTDAEGNLEWKRGFDWSYKKTSGNLVSVHETEDGGYFLACYINEPQGPEDEYRGDVMVAKLNSRGDVAWKKLFKKTDSIFMAQQTSDGGYIVGAHKWDSKRKGELFDIFWLYKLGAK